MLVKLKKLIMKKSKTQKTIDVKNNEHKWLSFFHDKFIMVAYSDLILVPNQALLLGYIRGMMATNNKRKNMKKNDRVWMKDSMKKMAFLTGISESTVKDYISTLLEKQYIIKGNFSTEQDNTNWYTINQDKIILDFKSYLNKQIEDLKILEQKLKSESDLMESANLMDENHQLNSQKSPSDTVEIDETLLYNILENDIIELESNKIALDKNNTSQIENLESQYIEIMDFDDIRIHLSFLMRFEPDRINERIQNMFLNKFLDQEVENIKSKDDLMKNYYRFMAKLNFRLMLNKDESNYCLTIFDSYFKKGVWPQPAKQKGEDLTTTSKITMSKPSSTETDFLQNA